MQFTVYQLACVTSYTANLHNTFSENNIPTDTYKFVFSILSMLNTCSYTDNRQDVSAAWCSIRQATEKLYQYVYFKSHPDELDMWLTQSHFWILLCDYNIREQ